MLERCLPRFYIHAKINRNCHPPSNPKRLAFSALYLYTLVGKKFIKRFVSKYLNRREQVNNAG